jgi:ATP-dependent RNA helicase DeaD
MADIDVIWGVAPAPDEIRALDQQRMMQSTLFSDQATDEDVAFARALLAERSTEEIATALARIYRSQLPAPEDILDPGESRRSRDDRGPREDRSPRKGTRDRGERDRGEGDRGPRAKPRGLPEGGVWFRAAIGRRKNAEARWLLPMICRRGNIGKQDIGAIRIFDTATEFEISAHAAEQFALQVKRPDKEDNIRIEALPDGPQGETSSGERDFRKAPHRDSSDAPRRKENRTSSKANRRGTKSQSATKPLRVRPGQRSTSLRLERSPKRRSHVTSQRD